MGEGVIIAVTGLKREAGILAGDRVRALAGGGDRRRLEAALDSACAGAAGVISIGLGGALASGLAPGDWVTASGVVLPAGRIPTDPDWSERLALQLAPSM